jgi:hypothetical protein
MNKNIKKQLLKILKAEGASLFEEQVKEKLPKVSIQSFDHIVGILVDEGFIKKTKAEIGLIFSVKDFYLLELTAKGYKYLKPWYSKFLSFITDDMTKIFSLIALLISILVGLKQLEIF